MSPIKQAIALIQKANSELEPELMTAADARDLMAAYSQIVRLGSFGVAALSRKVNDAKEVARTTGTSLGHARTTIDTGKVLAESPVLGAALQKGTVSLEQATEIARAESAKPGTAKELLPVARNEPFHVLKDKARKIALEAEQHRGLAERQHEARSGRSYSDELGMVHIHLALEPHVGTPIVAGAEAEAERLAAAAKKNGETEPFERYVADAYAKRLTGGGKGRATRPELVIVASLGVAQRGWKDVREGEVCKIPGVGPVAPHVARRIADDAFISGVIHDGRDLRQFKTWSRHIPAEIRRALELGDPPDFDGIRCVDCGNHFRTQFDHVQPHSNSGPTSHANLKPRCWTCHRAKTESDRKANKLKVSPGKRKQTSGGRGRLPTASPRPSTAAR